MFLDVQINYLLFLQHLRELSGGMFDSFFLALTNFGESLLPIIFISFLYWSINKKAGEFLFLTYSFSLYINQFLKMIFCIERPWILSDKITPVKEALPHASGYSFPSGHTTTATSVWGALAIKLWDKKPARYFLICLVLTVAFSRNYLGVHTIQDVLVAFVYSLIIVIFVNHLFNKSEEQPKILDKLLIFGTLSMVIGDLIIYFKPFIINLLFNSNLPILQPKSFWANAGSLLGIVFGLFLSQKFVVFDTYCSLIKRILRFVFGISIYLIFYNVWHNMIFGDSGSIKLGFLCPFILNLYLTFIYPLIFSKVEKLLNCSSPMEQ